jgi:hypothetical protein
MAAYSEIVLHFEVAADRHPDTAVIAQALIDWVGLVRDAARAISPEGKIELTLVGNDVGSLRFPQVLKFIEGGLQNIDGAWVEYPLLKKAALGSAHVLAAAAIGLAVQSAATPEVQKVELSAEDRKILERMEVKIAESAEVKSSSRRFYETVSKDPAITGVGVAQDRQSLPSVIVPNTQFAERSGLFTQEIDEIPGRKVTDVWDVVLIKAAFSHKQYRWNFSRDGLNFSAVMQDAIFLDAIKDGRVPINIQEGVVMKVEVEYTERLNGQVWESVPSSRRIKKVISPIPTPPKSGSDKP